MASKPAPAISAWYNGDEFAASDHDPILIAFNPLAGDFSDDGIVDLNTDGGQIRAAVGKKVGDPGVDRRMDLDGDGIVSLQDYRLWVALYQAYQASLPR